MTVCFADKVAGVWQGGSGLALTGHTPMVPGNQAYCSFSDFTANPSGKECIEKSFCGSCRYWPVYPKTVECAAASFVSCIHAYTDDAIACGTDYYAYKVLAAEGYDARMLSFPGGGHKNPANAYAWKAGCLGMAPACSDNCAAALDSCIVSSSAPTAAIGFADCFSSIFSCNV